jgi:hypothetical protein
MLLQATIGVVQIWGNINVYVTSYLRVADPSIRMQDTFFVFAGSILIGAIFMQLASYMIEHMHPRIQTLIGGLSLIIPLYVCSYLVNYYAFLGLYTLGNGVSFGILYMPGIKHSWVFFPERKGLISGIILACYSIGSILSILIA